MRFASSICQKTHINNISYVMKELVEFPEYELFCEYKWQKSEASVRQ